MSFDPKKASAIIKRWRLSPRTLKVWRYRGEIPPRYFDGEPIPIREAARLKCDPAWIQRFEQGLEELSQGAREDFVSYYETHLISSEAPEDRIRKRLFDALRYAKIRR